MDFIDIILVYGILTSLLLSALILVSLYIQPRIWMQDLPKEVQQSIPPKNKREKKQTLIVMILFLVILILLPAFAVTRNINQPTFLQAWLITYSIYFIFNLTDLLIIDWLIICTFTPSFIKIKGIDEQVYKNYRKHLLDFLKGVAIITVPSFVSCLLGYYLNKSSIF